MKDRFAKLLFYLALIGLGFGYGYASNQFEIFPYKLVHNGYLAFRALVDLRKQKFANENVDFWDETGISGPTYKTLNSNAGSEDIFILGNELPYANSDGSNAYLAWIADRDGKILHAWKDPGEIWAPLENREVVGGIWRSYPVGAYLYPNGDLLVSYHGVGMFPSAMGLAKFDKDSHLLWKRSDYFHHWFDVGPNGNIYIPDYKIVESPLQISDHDKRFICRKTKFTVDTIAVLDPDGNKIKEISMQDALVNSDLAGLFNSNQQNARKIESCDPTHLNDAVILRQDEQPDFPEFSPGDLLVSFRTLNTVAVLDPVTERFKWHAVGSSHHQHSPRFYRNNTIFAFDNFGGRLSRGQSRILAIDVGTHVTKTIFPRDDAALPDMPFDSDTAGHIDVDPSKSHILVAFTHQGLVWEIDVNTGEILWEFVNTHSVDGKPARVSVYTAKYVKDLDFDLNYGILP